MTAMTQVDLLRASYDAAVAAADPLQMLAQHLPDRPRRAVVVGAGKAAASMAAAVERAWSDVELDGVVITRYAHGLPTRDIRVVEAGHPVPDEAGAAAAEEILTRAGSLNPGDLLLALISGGGSSLLSLPAVDVPMADLKQVTRDLLASGAPIEQMNVVRKHLSRIAGGQLALSAATRGAQVCALIVSDVTGDAPADIASGPCAADPSTFADATAVLRRWKVTPPHSVATRLARGERGEIAETPKPGDPRLDPVENRIIATARSSLVAAAGVFRDAGITPVILGDTVTGEAREVAKVYAALVREIRAHAAPFAPPVALISGGECTVTLPRGVRGRGGRCSEFLLSLAVELENFPDVYALAADTDGIDGSEDNAGAWCAPDTAERAARAGVAARTALDAHDAWGYFAAAGTLIVTGPTRTNVNDYRVILVG
ncbi:MAG TPA: glycerate kinase [Burkholderiaceae bacterium]|nr:glycerate kinase [Burkholderiaceae bacterium]HQR69281.1 glycerate kinase [Burkholderiaceae bacterium]